MEQKLRFGLVLGLLAALKKVGHFWGQFFYVFTEKKSPEEGDFYGTEIEIWAGFWPIGSMYFELSSSYSKETQWQEVRKLPQVKQTSL